MGESIVAFGLTPYGVLRNDGYVRSTEAAHNWKLLPSNKHGDTVKVETIPSSLHLTSRDGWG